MRQVLFVIVLLFCGQIGMAADPPNISQYLQDVSVTIHAGSTSPFGGSAAQGSGVIVTRGDVSYVLTAAHVIAGLRTTRIVIDAKNGQPRTVVDFKDAKIVREETQDGRTVGRSEMDCEVVRYSEADDGEDLALLRVRKKGYTKASARFWGEATIPPPMTRLVHCGSLLGQVGANSLTTGIVSQIGRVSNGKIYDQTTCTAFPGSSGGGVFTEDGRYAGMITRGAGEGFNLCVPIRRMRAWAVKTGIEFILDAGIAVPTDEQLKAKPVDDAGSAFEAKTTTQPAAKSLPAILRILPRVGR